MSDVACCICLGILCPAAGQLLDVTSASMYIAVLEHCVPSHQMFVCRHSDCCPLSLSPSLSLSLSLSVSLSHTHTHTSKIASQTQTGPKYLTCTAQDMMDIGQSGSYKLLFNACGHGAGKEFRHVHISGHSHSPVLLALLLLSISRGWFPLGSSGNGTQTCFPESLFQASSSCR